MPCIPWILVYTHSVLIEAMSNISWGHFLTANMLLQMINGNKVASATVSAKGIIERQSVRDYKTF